MSFLNNIKISIKLPLIMLSLSAVALIAMGLLAYYDAKETLVNGAKERMQIALENRSDSVSTWHNNLSKEVIAQSSSPSTRRALNEFIGAWVALPGDKTEFLHEHFPPATQTETEIKTTMDFSAVQTDYSRRHRRHHPYFATVLERNAYYDVFLFDPEGNLIYTVAKEVDYATNIVTGEFNKTGLAEAFQKAIVLGANETVLIDLAPYGPSNGNMAGFMAAPILSVNGSVMGVYAIQISTETIHKIFESNAGLGETGITLAVGPDYHLRMSSRHADDLELSKITVEKELVDQAFLGTAGITNTIGVNGNEVLAVYSQLQFGNLTWAMIAQQDAEELLAPAISARNQMVIDGAIIAALSALIAMFLARSVGRPLAGVGEAMKQVALEDYETEIPSVNRGDEIGEIASILEDFRVTLKSAKEGSAESLFKGTAFEAASAGLMIVDQDFTIRALNSSVTDLLVEHEEQFKTVLPAFDARQVIGSNMDIFHDSPDHARNLLENPENLPFQAEIPVGNMRFSLYINAVLGDEGEQVGFVVEWQDVTLVRMGDSVLKAIEENQAKAEFTPDGILLSANDNFLKLTGGIDNGQIGKDLDLLIKFDAEQMENSDKIKSDLSEGKSFVGKFRMFAGEDCDGMLEGAFSPVHDKSGEMNRILLVGSDVTEAQSQIEKSEATRLELEKAQAEVVDALRVGMRQLSSGDLTAKIEQKFMPEYEQLRSDFNGAVGTLREAMLNVTENAESIRGEASDISNAADDLSRRTERQAATLEETAAALDELTVSVRSAADGAEKANQVVADAKENAETSGNVVREAVEAMGEIQSSSSQISRIISVIDDIAFQTNLLALNAGVEAARAGEAGRGFAVVASEVRALAQRSSDAAREINDLISASSQHVNRGVDLVGRAGEALGEIFESVSNISNHVSAIAKSSSEQSSGLVEINTSVNQLDQVTQQNVAMFEETTAASHSLTKEAEILSDTMAKFQTGSPESNVVAADFQTTRNVGQSQVNQVDQVNQPAPLDEDFPKDAATQTVVQATTLEQIEPTPQGDWEDF